MKKIIMWAFVFILIVSVAQAVTITKFTNNKATENITLSSYVNVTRYVDIPQYANVSSAIINYKVQNQSNYTFFDTFDRKNNVLVGNGWYNYTSPTGRYKANITDNRLRFYKLTAGTGNSGVYRYFKDNGVNTYYNASYIFEFKTGSANLYFRSHANSTLNFGNSSFTVQYSVSANEIYLYRNKTLIDTQPFTFSTFVNYSNLIIYNTTTINIKIYDNLFSEPPGYNYSYNITLNESDLFGNNYWLLFSGATASTDVQIDINNFTFQQDNNVTMNFSSYISNESRFMNRIINKFANPYNSFKSNISYLLEACNCNDCTLSANICKLPLLFESQSNGIMNYNDLQVNYSYYPANLTVNLYDSDSLALIQTNITTQFIGAVFQDENLTDLGQAKFRVILNQSASDSGVVRAFSFGNTDYSIAQRTFTLLSGGNDTLDVYLTNTSDATLSQEVTFVTKDESLNNIENALVKIYKQNPSTGQFILLTELYTNGDGEATTKLIKDTVYYRVIVEYQGRQVYISENPFSISSSQTTINLFCVLETSNTNSWIQYNNIQAIFGFNRLSNSSGYWSLTYNSPVTIEICANIYKIANTIRTNISYYCENGTSNVIDFATITVSEFTTIYGVVSIDLKDGYGKINVISGQDYLGLDDVVREEKGRLIIYFGLILLCGIAFVFSPVVGIIVFIIGNVAILLSKFTILSNGIIMTIISLSLFVLFTYTRRKNG